MMCDFIQNFEDYIRHQLNYAVDYVVVTITLYLKCSHLYLTFSYSKSTNGNNKTICEICSKLRIETPERHE